MLRRSGRVKTLSTHTAEDCSTAHCADEHG
jgi:hypothetical protein